MKKRSMYFLLGSLLCFGACSNDEDTGMTSENEEENEQPTTVFFSPKISGIVDEGVVSKAGIEENNVDFKDGEKFYWSLDDQALVVFQSKTQDYNTGLNYVVKSVDPDDRSLATLETEGEISTDTYNILGFYPGADYPGNSWIIRNAGSFFEATFTMPLLQWQDADNSSLHAGRNMPMRAFGGEVEVEDENTPISLVYEQLASVIRFRVKNDNQSEHGIPGLKVAGIQMTLNGSDCYFNDKMSYSEENGTPVMESEKSKSSITLLCANGAFDDEDIFTGFISLLPLEADKLSDVDVTIYYTDANNKYYKVVKSRVDCTAFWEDGIESGTGYYLQLSTSNLTALTYKIGDYYPISDNADTAEGIVFWTENGGQNGKIVSLIEGADVMWSGEGTDKVEYSVMDNNNGKTNWDKLLVKNSAFSNLPAFLWVLNDLNGGKTDGDWYLPAFYELEYILCWATGNDNETWDSGSPKFSLFDLSAANNKLTATPEGAALQAEYYWSSTEGSTGRTNAYKVSFEGGRAMDGNKGLPSLVRGVKKF